MFRLAAVSLHLATLCGWNCPSNFIAYTSNSFFFKLRYFLKKRADSLMNCNENRAAIYIHMCAFEKKKDQVSASMNTGCSNCCIHYYYLIKQRNATIYYSHLYLYLKMITKYSTRLESLVLYNKFKCWSFPLTYKNGTCLMQTE